MLFADLLSLVSLGRVWFRDYAIPTSCYVFYCCPSRSNTSVLFLIDKCLFHLFLKFMLTDCVLSIRLDQWLSPRSVSLSSYHPAVL